MFRQLRHNVPSLLTVIWSGACLLLPGCTGIGFNIHTDQSRDLVVQKYRESEDTKEQSDKRLKQALEQCAEWGFRGVAPLSKKVVTGLEFRFLGKPETVYADTYTCAPTDR